MQTSQDFISTFWLTSHGKMPTEWFISGQCQNRHQRQTTDFHPCVDFVPIKAWCLSHPGWRKHFRHYLFEKYSICRAVNAQPTHQW